MSSAEWLLERMAAAGDSDAIVWGGDTYTYSWLIDEIGRARKALADAGLGHGRVVSLEADYSPRSVAMEIALIDMDTVLVPLTEAVAAEREEFLDIAEVEFRVQLDGSDEWSVTETGATASHDMLRGLMDIGHPGLVLFSSGSTGKPKAALHDFLPLMEKFKVPRHTLRSLTFLLLDHIGGQNTLFYVLSNAGTIVTVSERDPDSICAAIEKHRVELLPTSPTFLNLLLISEAYQRHDLSSLQLVTYGTEVMPQSTLDRLHEALPHVRLLQTYGLSELGILRSKSRDDNSLWVKVGGEGFETKVVDGILWIKAASAMVGYLNHPSPFDEDGWFNTGDMVEVDGEWIKILGRESEIINVGGLKVYPAEVESVLLELDNVADVVVSGEPNPITGNIVVARFSLEEEEPLRDLKKRVREHCRDRLATFKVPAKVEIAAGAQHSARFKKMRNR